MTKGFYSSGFSCLCFDPTYIFTLYYFCRFVHWSKNYLLSFTCGDVYRIRYSEIEDETDLLEVFELVADNVAFPFPDGPFLHAP